MWHPHSDGREPAVVSDMILGRDSFEEDDETSHVQSTEDVALICCATVLVCCVCHHKLKCGDSLEEHSCFSGGYEKSDHYENGKGNNCEEAEEFLRKMLLIVKKFL